MNKSAKVFLIVLLCVFVLVAAYLFILFKPYRSMAEFAWVKIGKTTYDQVVWVFPGTVMHTSFGGIGEYPTRDGRFIVIRYYGPDLVVGDICIAEESMFPELQDFSWKWFFEEIKKDK